MNIITLDFTFALPEVEDNFSKINGNANLAKSGVDAKQSLLKTFCISTA